MIISEDFKFKTAIRIAKLMYVDGECMSREVTTILEASAILIHSKEPKHIPGIPPHNSLLDFADKNTFIPKPTSGFSDGKKDQYGNEFMNLCIEN